MWMNSEPNRAKRNRPKEKGPSAAPKTEPISTGVIDAVNENGRVASIQICTRLGPAPAVKVCPDAIRCFLHCHYGRLLAEESKGDSAELRNADCGMWSRKSCGSCTELITYVDPSHTPFVLSPSATL